MHYELFKDAAGHWRWHLLGHNGRKLAASGEAFASYYDAHRSMVLVRDGAASASLPADPYSADVLRRALLRTAARRDARQRALASRIFGPH